MVPKPLVNMGKKKEIKSPGRKRPYPEQSDETSETNEILPNGDVSEVKIKKAKKDNKPKLNQKEVQCLKERLIAEDKFISNIVSLIYVPKHKLNGMDEMDSDEDDMKVSEEMKKSVFGTATRAKSMDELHARLEKKMEELRGTKNPNKKSKSKKLTKLERKQKAVEAKKLRKKLLKAGKNPGLANGTTLNESKKKPTTPKKPVVNSEGKIVFSKFDFSESKSTSGPDGKKQNLDPKSALQKLKKHKEKLKSLESIGKTERVKNIEDKTAWKSAINRAEGVKVKDDEALLKKSIKKQEQKKKSTKKKWEERDKVVDKRKEAKQNRRTENIKKRKDQNKQTKIKKAMKKGRLVPGFR